jgi:hypothetical protein
MLKMDAKNVPGRKIAPIIESLFSAFPSFFAACEMRLWSVIMATICRLTIDSR